MNPIGSSQRRRVVLTVAALSVVAGGVAVLLSAWSRTQPGQGQVSAGQPGRPAIEVGWVATLPPPPPTLVPSVKLSAPSGVVDVPGRHRLGSVVTFELPIRNDGSETLAFDKIEPK